MSTVWETKLGSKFLAVCFCWVRFLGMLTSCPAQLLNRGLMELHSSLQHQPAVCIHNFTDEQSLRKAIAAS